MSQEAHVPCRTPSGRTAWASLRAFTTTQPANSAGRNASTWGVLKLNLHASSYDWEFVPIAGQTRTDTGTALCH